MNDPFLSFFAYGEPAPGGSKSVFPMFRGTGDDKKFLFNKVTDAGGEKTKAWRQAVAWYAKKAMLERGLRIIPEGVPIRTEATFYRRPAKHLTNKFGLLKPSSPKRPTGKPDLLKYMRSTEDALTGIVWVDDSQVCLQLLGKEWCRSPVAPAGASIRVYLLD